MKSDTKSCINCFLAADSDEMSNFLQTQILKQNSVCVDKYDRKFMNKKWQEYVRTNLHENLFFSTKHVFKTLKKYIAGCHDDRSWKIPRNSASRRNGPWRHWLLMTSSLHFEYEKELIFEKIHRFCNKKANAQDIFRKCHSRVHVYYMCPVGGLCKNYNCIWLKNATLSLTACISFVSLLIV